MALWPFGKNKEEDSLKDAPAGAPGAKPGAAQQDVAGVDSSGAAAGSGQPDPSEDATGSTSPERPDVEITSIPHDPVGGTMGPFDGDKVKIEDFDFSDFSLGLLELGSLRIPLPKNSQVQVEMGASGPRMLHIVTHYGRITPVAFAAPRSPGQWAESGKDLIKGVANDGLATHVEQGPWGSEIVGVNENGTIRIIGIEGPRWLLRLTTAAPTGKEDDLATLAREVAARTFVYRGEEPILAGNSLPISMPQPLVEQVQKAMNERAAQQQNTPENAAEQDAINHMRSLRTDDSAAPNGSADAQGEK
ncbi:hypothetical protein CPHO_05290 [Corynebacterium phocae]|uniref:DUF3710 domain-containing protein n=1 Tax=Corynebacterium phocae TaxID=161895 RepID=A0A1L7D2U7_9CORY|nr:DUF3710 domain-containing protein [Corynebacterium phocae]APT92403.1 hypothetical protein CPHO_05290 [Corynebacterium phocae]KAA8724997.1 DUF3710 domain-containing protein [Corynebacterium phocae]